MVSLDSKFKGKKAAFVISCSPFQIMCMIEAIKAFEPADYRVFMCYDNKEIPRKKQALTLLEQYNIKFEEESFNYRITKLDRLKMLKPVLKGFDQVFIGDCCNELLIYKATRFVSNGGTMIYLDDGTSTIQFFNGLYQIEGNLRRYYDFVAKIRHLDFDRYNFTIYKGLDDGRHVCLLNNFKFFSSQQLGKEETKNIVLLGIDSNYFCREEQIPVDVFMAELRKIILGLKEKYPSERIVYVPHGKDTSNVPKQLCEELDVDFRPTSISVEMFLLDVPYRPKAVYGFSSSALYNLKLLFPSADVVNYTFSGNTPLSDRAENAALYYEQHGIPRNVRHINL